jgi:hypothetical protein
MADSESKKCLNLTDEQFQQLAKSLLLLFPHKKSTDIEAGISVKPTKEELDTIVSNFANSIFSVVKISKNQ